jgi:ankyrin repeat protein
MHFAAFGGHSGTVALLIENDAQIDALNGTRETPAQVAAAAGHRNLATLLEAAAMGEK